MTYSKCSTDTGSYLFTSFPLPSCQDSAWCREGESPAESPVVVLTYKASAKYL